MTTISKPKTSADYQNMLLGLAKNINPTPELEKTLSDKPSDSSRWKNPLTPNVKPTDNKIEIETAIKTVFRLAGIVQGTLQSEILSRTSSISPNNDSTQIQEDISPEEIRKKLQAKSAAATLVCALQPRNPQKGTPLQNWEATSRAMSLSDLKAKTIIRAALASEDIFNSVIGSPELQKNLEDGIKIFREASRSFEISLAAKNNTQAGPGKAATHVRNISPKGLEIISCLAQIAIECVRNSTKELPETEETSIRNFQANCRRAFGIAYSATQSTEDSQRKSITQIQELLSQNLLEKTKELQNLRPQWENWKNPEGDSLVEENSKILTALFSEIPMSKSNQILLESLSKQNSISEFLEEETTEREWVTVRHLEKIYNKFEKELAEANSLNSLNFTAPISLRIFATFRKEAAELGKASTMVLAGKILNKPSDIALFEKREKNNEGDILSAFPSVQKTRSIQQEAGRTLQPAGFGPHERNILEELSQIADSLDYARNLLFCKPVVRTLNAKERTAAELSAKKIMDGNPENSPMDQDIQKIYLKVSETTKALEAEIGINANRMNKLPKLLRDQEASRTLNAAVGRLLRSAESCKDQLQKILTENHPVAIKNAASTLLEISEKATSQEGITNPDLADISKRLSPMTSKTGSIGTLLAHLADRRGTNGTYANTEELATILLLETQEKPENHMDKDTAEKIVKIENQRKNQENDAPFTKIKTPELGEIVRLTGDKVAQKQLLLRAQNRFIRDLSTIRFWKEKTNGLDRQEAKTLATELCLTSPTIKKACGSQILKNIEEACQPPIWNNHSSMAQAELDKSFTSIKQSYSVLRALFKKEKAPTLPERELFGLIQKMQTLTEEISGNSPSKWVRAELLAQSLANKGELRTCQLQIFKNLMEIPQDSSLTEPSLEFLQCWNNYTGNREALLKTAILLPKEQKNTDKINTAEYLASTIEAHSTNLKELFGYMKAVCDSPQALAETYLQHTKNQTHEAEKDSPTTQNAWKESMLQEAEVTKENAKNLDDEIETMKQLFATKIKEASKLENSLEKEEFLDPRFHRAFDSMISQKEKELQRLILKENRIHKLIQMAEDPKLSANKKQEKNGEPSTLDLSSPEEDIENTLAKALDLALTANQQKLSLPKNIQPAPEIDANEILDASMAHKKIAICKDTLLEIAKRLRETNPKIQNVIEKLDQDNANLTSVYRELKETLFDSIINCEILTMQTRRNPEDINPELKSLKARLMAENFHLKEEQRKWVATLTRTAQQFDSTFVEPPKIDKAPKTPKTPPPPKEEPVQD